MSRASELSASGLRIPRWTALFIAILIAECAPAHAQTETNCVTPPSGLIAWWPGDGTATNLVGVDLPVLQGGASFTTGMVDHAFGFDISNDRASIVESAELDITLLPQWTIAAWVYPTNLSKSWPIIYSDGYFRASLGLLSGSGRPESWINNANRLNGTIVVPSNQWTHLALTYTNSNRTFYVNGQFAGSDTTLVDPSGDSTGSAIGAVPGSDNRTQFGGHLDEVSLFNRALAVDEILSICAARSAGMCKPPQSPAIVVQPQSLTVGIGSNAVFISSTGGTAPLSYQWLFNGTNLPAGTNATLAVSNTQPAESGSYVVIVTNDYGRTTSSVAVLTVVAPPFITAQPQSQSWPVGYPFVRFNVGATSITAMTFQWLKDGADLPGATNSTYLISPLRASYLGTYAVRVSNFAGVTVSSDAVLVTESPDPTNCFQSPVGLVAWWPGDGNGLNLVGTNSVVYAGATNVPGIVDQAFRFNGISSYVSAGDDPLLSPHAGTNGEMTVMTWVQVTHYTNNLRCLLGKGVGGAWEYALHVDSTGGVRFVTWGLSPVYSDCTGGKLNPSQWHHVAATLKKGQFARVYVDGLQVAEDTTFGGTTSDGTAAFYIGKRGDGLHFAGVVDEVLLFNRVLDSNVFRTIYETGGSGLCKSALPPTILFAPSNRYVAQDSAFELIADAGGTSPLSFQWLFNGTNIDGATNSALTIPSAQPSHSGAYALLVSNAYGTVSTPPANITNVPPPFITLHPQSRTLPVGYPAVTFNVAATSITTIVVQWLKDGVDLPGATNTTLLISPLRTNDLGTYVARVSNFAGASFSSNAVLASDSLELTNCVQCPAGLLAWWPADGNASNLVDCLHGTFSNGVISVPGLVEQAFRFDGRSNYVVVADHPVLSPHIGTNGEMTVMAWIRVTNYPSASQPFLAKGMPGQWEYSLYLNNNGSVQFYIWPLSAGSYYAQPSGGRINAGQWHHVAGTLRKGQFARVYLDGVQVGHQTSFGPDTGDGASPFYIGRRGDTAAYFNGLVDEVILFNAALSSNELAAVYTAGANGLCKDSLPPTTLSWPTNQYVALGSNITLSVTASGTAPLNYQWLFNGTNLPGATEPTLIITDANTNHTGSYSVIATNTYGFALSRSAVINVFPIPIESPVFIVSNAVISATDTNYEGRNLVLVGSTLTIDGLHSFNSLLLTNQATNAAILRHSPGAASGLHLLLREDCWISSNCLINLAGLGFPSDSGPGRGQPHFGLPDAHAGGAGQGGIGGVSRRGRSGGTIYGSISAPVDFGSGGGTGGLNSGYDVSGGSGGGAIRLTVIGNLTLNGNLTANGSHGGNDTWTGHAGGGGSAGSIWLIAGAINGNGKVSADGGNGGGGNGGGGAGGRIAVYYTHNDFTGTVSARGGGGYQAGGAGTIYWRRDGQTNGDLVVDGGGQSGAKTPLLQGTYVLDDVQILHQAIVEIGPSVQLRISSSTMSLATNGQLLVKDGGLIEVNLLLLSAGGSLYLNDGGQLTVDQVEVLSGGKLFLNAPATFPRLHIASGGALTHSPLDRDFYLVVTADMIIDTGGTIDVNGYGYGSDSGPGAGQAHSGLPDTHGGGAGHGGLGGISRRNRAGGQIYGSMAAPSDFGSGGGTGGLNSGYDIGGGSGGGAIRLTVLGNLTLNGNLAANGSHGGNSDWTGHAGGGGSGGSIWLNASALNGNGTISANGGNGGGGNGGGGAGGRIALYITNFSFAGVISVNGGTGFQQGGGGSYFTPPMVLANPESFESGWNGWWQEGSVWSLRRPGNGPVDAYGGTNALCGNSGGNYAAASEGRLISPRFIVPSVFGADRVILRFRQWYHYGAGDAGLVQISTPYDSNWVTLSTVATNGTSGSWVLATFDLTQFQGQEVQLAFYHTANNDGSRGAGWFMDDVTLSQATPARLTVNTPSVQRFTANQQAQYFVVTAPAGGHLRITLTDTDNIGINELYVRRGSLPSPGAYDFRYNVNGGADQSIFVPNAGAGDWFILAYNDSGPVPGDYSLAVEFKTGVILDRLAPPKVGNSLPGAVTLHGAGFTPSDTVALVNGGSIYLATNVSFISASALVADFAFPSIPTNIYSLVVTSGTNSDSLLFEILQGIGAKFQANLTVPATVGRNAVASLYVEYSNTGDAAMPAPLLVLSGSDNAKLTMKAPSAAPDFWTSALPRDANDTVHFLASGQIAGMLQPGERVRLPVHYLGAGGNNNVIRFALARAAIALEDREEPPRPEIDWAALKDGMRPLSIPPDAWDALWENFTSAAGDTWLGYYRMLTDNAAYLGRLGYGNLMRHVPSLVNAVQMIAPQHIGDMLAFEFAQADGLHIVRFLASSTDGFAPTPGLRLSIERVYPNRITGRFQLGAFGRGWSHNWETRLERASDGTVTVVGPAGARRTFKPDSRGGWFNDPGDYATLASLGGGAYSLREKNGLLRVFHPVPNGKLNYVQDPNGTRITCGYSGNDLSSLTHSPSGQSLQLTYSGGRIASIIDSVGRESLFTYTGDHLTSVRYFDGSIVNYDYSSGQGTIRGHALTQIAYLGGTHEYFAYDAQGRLNSMSRDAGAEAVSFGFDNAGLVTATDAYGNTTQFYLDHRGLLAKAENPLGNTVRLAYDDRFNLTGITDPAGRTHEYAYDATGNLVDATDSLGNHTRFAYGGPLQRLNLLLDAKGNQTRYSHDANGNLSAIAYANNTIERWTYDPAGNPTNWVNRRTNFIRYEFNASGQLTAKLYPDGSRADYGYERGNLVTASNYTGLIRLAYDGNDRLQRITYPGDRWLEYAYNTAGQRASMTDQLGYRLDYEYDAVGRLRSITNSGGTHIVLYEYDAAGRLARKTLGNNVYTTYTYDRVGHLLTLTNAKPDDSILSFFNYTYDSRGRRTAMVTHYGEWTYGYDDDGQLINAALDSSDASIADQSLTYTYDALGNRIRAMENGLTRDYTANNLNQYTQVGALMLRYDNDGSLTQEVTGASALLAITNNIENRVIGFGSTNKVRQFDYDALGFASIVTRNGAQSFHVHDPSGLGNLVAVYDAAGVLQERYNHDFGTLSKEVGGGESFLSFDPVGNLSESTSSDALLATAHAFAPFGTQIRESVGTPMLFGFGGEFGVTAEADLHFMRARFYDPSLGRFSATDPSGLDGGDVNLYRYVRNNPASDIDPAGMKKFRFWQRKFPDLGRNSHPIQPSTGWDVFQEIMTFGWESFMESRQPKPMVFDVGDSVGEWLRGEGPSSPDEQSSGSRPPPDGRPNPSRPFNFPPVQPPPMCTPTDDPGLMMCMPGDELDDGTSRIPQARDPNEKSSPAGFGPRNFVRFDNLLPYTIHFENATNATAPAQQVFVTDQLTNLLDWQTFELTEIAFGDVFIPVPPGTRHFEKNVPMRFDGVDFEVQIEAGIRLASGEVYATFRSVDARTGLPPQDPAGEQIIGFLPPENGTGRGQGHIGYVIRAHTNLVTGTEIRNVAFITFDTQPAIRTDQVDPHDFSKGIDTNKQALVTIDADAPASSVIGPSGLAESVKLNVCWSGTDPGSGIAGHDVYVSTNGVIWTLWLSNTSTNCATFLGLNDTTYYFYSIGRDNTGQIEAAPPAADVSVITPVNSPPELDRIPNFVISVNQTLVFTNHAIDPDLPAQILTFTFDQKPDGATIDPDTGVFRWTPRCDQGSSSNRIVARVADNGAPLNLSATRSFSVMVHECIEASLGNTVVQVGASNSVVIRLLSTVLLTNLSFTVVPEKASFTNFGVIANTNIVLPPFTSNLPGGEFFIDFTLPADRILHGPTNVGELTFLALPNQSSDFVSLDVINVTGHKTNGTLAANAYGYPGRVVIVGEAPLLEAMLSTNGQVALLLYAIPGTVNVLETATAFPPQGLWTPWHTNLQTTLADSLPPLSATNRTLFIRAVRQ